MDACWSHQLNSVLPAFAAMRWTDGLNALQHEKEVSQTVTARVWQRLRERLPALVIGDALLVIVLVMRAIARH